MAKGIRMPIPSKTHGRAVKRRFRVFVDLGGKKHVASIVRDDFSRHAWMYFVFHKHDAASVFDKFLADPSVEGTPSEVVIVRSDDGEEFMEGKFSGLFTVHFFGSVQMVKVSKNHGYKWFTVMVFTLSRLDYRWFRRN